MISIAGLDKAAVLMALYDAARPLGMGFLHYRPEPMTREQADGLLAKSLHFDYVGGRPLKIDLSGDELNQGLYDRDQGEGAAQRCIDKLRVTK